MLMLMLKLLVSIVLGLVYASTLPEGRIAASKNFSAKPHDIHSGRISSTKHGHWQNFQPESIHTSNQGIRSKYFVNGKTIPNVSFDVGDSFAGEMPVSGRTGEEKKLFFWYFPAADKASKDLTFFFGGGPACSSMYAVLHQNSPIHWPEGAIHPTRNAHSWTNLTNVIWIDAPFGSGYAAHQPDYLQQYDSSDEIAEEFASWFHVFLETFTELQEANLYLVGEGDAAPYVSRIADIVKNSTQGLHSSPSPSDAHSEQNLRQKTSVLTNFRGSMKGVMLWNPRLTENSLYRLELCTAAWAKRRSKDLRLNATFLLDVERKSKKCGYDAYLSKYAAYPAIPAEPFFKPSCDIWESIHDAAREKNACFNLGKITDVCPIPFDVLGDNGAKYSDKFKPWFDKPEVKTALHAPQQKWELCSRNWPYRGPGNPPRDMSPSEVYVSVLPRIMEAGIRTIFVQGDLQFRRSNADCLRLQIQNMVWNKVQGFEHEPNTSFFTEHGSKPVGIYHTERNLTYVQIDAAGGLIAADAPVAAWSLMQYLLGQTERLSV